MYLVVVDGAVSSRHPTREAAEARAEELGYPCSIVERGPGAPDFGRTVPGPYAIAPAAHRGRFFVLVDALCGMAERLEAVKARIRYDRGEGAGAQSYTWDEVCRFVREAGQMY